MSEKRKDSKGRVLKDGESQRANGTYDYRYTDIHKKRRCIYAKSLTELRKKEEELWRDLADGIDYAAGEMTVADLVTPEELKCSTYRIEEVKAPEGFVRQGYEMSLYEGETVISPLEVTGKGIYKEN